MISAMIPEQLPELVGPEDIEAGVIYITAQNGTVYAVTKTVLMLVDDPSADVGMVTGPGNYLTDRQGKPRFPMRRAPSGSQIVITQE